MGAEASVTIEGQKRMCMEASANIGVNPDNGCERLRHHRGTKERGCGGLGHHRGKTRTMVATDTLAIEGTRHMGA